MSEGGDHLKEPEIATGRSLMAEREEESFFLPFESPTAETSMSDMPGLVPGHPPSSDQSTPSPSAEVSGLLSLPWEMVTQIISHLPAQFVITVLPKVCQALGNVGEDSVAWQQRARRIMGSRVRFPVGPRKDFDWANACLEMERLMTCWADQAYLAARDTQGNNGEFAGQGAEGRAGEAGPPRNQGQEDGGAEDAEGIGVAELELALGVNEVMEVVLEDQDGENPPGIGVDPAWGVRARAGEQPEEAALALVEREDVERGLLDAIEGRERAAGRAVPQGDGGEVASEPLRSQSLPPALEHLVLHSGHNGPVNSVLLMGAEGMACASGSRDMTVNLWDLRDGHASPRTLLGHRGWVWCLASQGPLLASGGFDNTIRLWDLGAGGVERGLITTSAPVFCLSCQPGMLLAGTYDKKVSIYDTRAGVPLVKSLQLHGKAVMCLAADDNYIISGSEDCTVAIYDRRADKALKKLRIVSDVRSYLTSMSYQGSEVWAGDNKGKIYAFSVQSGVLKLQSQFDVGHTSLVTGIHKSAGSLYTCSSDRTLKVHIPSAPLKTLCTLNQQEVVFGLSVEAGVLAVATGSSVEVWRPRK